MKPPIIVEESGDVSIYGTVGDAELDLEPIDVREGRFVAYDSEGHLLELCPTEPRVTIKDIEPAPLRLMEVREALVGLLSSLGHPSEELSQEPLERLIERSMAYKTSY